MQKFYNKKSRSPFLNAKSPRLLDSSKEESLTTDNNSRDLTLEKLILQLDQMRRKHEQEKRDMIDAFNHQVQQKAKQYQKFESEYSQKNQLLEQLLFQEQSKTIHLTRLVQEKQKNIGYDKEKETYRNKIQQLESILQESQKNNQKVPNKSLQKDSSFKMMVDTINNTQANITRISKSKKLNVSWMDYEILESDLSLQKDISKQLAKLNGIFDQFFKQIQDSTTPQLSPYRVNNSQMQILNQDKGQLTPATPKKITKIKLVSAQTQTKEIYTKTSKIQQTEMQSNKNEVIQTDLLFEDSTQQLTQQIIKQTINQYVQTMEIVSHCSKKKHLSSQMNLIGISFQKLSPQLIVKIDHKYIQTEQTENTIQSQSIFMADSATQSAEEVQIVRYHQVTQTQAQTKTITTESQTDPLTRESLLEVEQQLIKHHSKITEKDETEEEDPIEIVKQKVKQVDIENENDSVFDCNKPDYDSVIEHHEELVDLRKECEEKANQIIKLELAFTQILQEKNGFQFDNLITSSQHSLQQLLNNKWTIKLKENEAQQRYTIGIIGKDTSLIENFVSGIYDIDYKVSLDPNQFAVKYYDRNFVENYRLDLMFKRFLFPSLQLVNSKQQAEEQQFEMFWIDFMTTQCNMIIYLANEHNEEDLKLIDYLKKKEKKITIISFSEVEIDDFEMHNNYKQNIQNQIIKIQNDRGLIGQLWMQITQSEWEWEDVQESLLSQLQLHLQGLVDNEDFMQLQIREDGIFELSVISDEIRQETLYQYPFTQQIIQEDNQIDITIKLFDNQQISEAKCLGNQLLIIIDNFILLEQLKQKTKLESINENVIKLSILQ